MPLYKDTDIQNLIALVNQANPGLPLALDEVNFIYGKPQVIAPALANGHNTRVRITPKGSSPYRGAVDVTYRRIDLATLFRSVKVEFTRWVNNNLYMVHAETVPILNKLYGLNLEVAKTTLSGSWHSSHTGQARNLAATVDNYFYVGTVSVYWHRGQQELGIDILTTSELNGALWPQGNDFVTTPDRAMQGEFLLAHLDFTEYAIATGWTASASGPTGINSSNHASLFNAINQATGLNLNGSPYNADTNPQGMQNYNGQRIVLPNAAFPMANKPGFAGAYVLNTDNHPTFKGKIVAYFNV